MHIRSETLPFILLQNSELDYAYGALTEAEELDKQLEFLALRTSRFDLIANYDFRKEHRIAPSKNILLKTVGDVQAPLLMANQGASLNTFLVAIDKKRDRRVPVEHYLDIVRSSFNVIELCNDVNFMLELLCTSQEKLCMFAMPEIVERAKQHVESPAVIKYWHKRGAEPPSIAHESLGQQLAFDIGVIRRKPKDPMESTHSPDHPFRIFWETCRDIASEGWDVS